MGVLQENLKALDDARAKGFHLQAYLLAHSTIESNLRGSVGKPESEVKFSALIETLRNSPKRFKGKTALVRDLCNLNTFRNKLIHELWTDGFRHTNGEAKRRGAWAIRITRRVLFMPTVRDIAGTRATLADLEKMSARLQYDPMERPRRKALGELLLEWTCRRREGWPARAIDALKPEIEKELRRQRLELRYLIYRGQPTICRILLRPAARP